MEEIQLTGRFSTDVEYWVERARAQYSSNERVTGILDGIRTNLEVFNRAPTDTQGFAAFTEIAVGLVFLRSFLGVAVPLDCFADGHAIMTHGAAILQHRQAAMQNGTGEGLRPGGGETAQPMTAPHGSPRPPVRQQPPADVTRRPGYAPISGEVFADIGNWARRLRAQTSNVSETGRKIVAALSDISDNLKRLSDAQARSQRNGDMESSLIRKIINSVFYINDVGVATGLDPLLELRGLKSWSMIESIQGSTQANHLTFRGKLIPPPPTQPTHKGRGSTRSVTEPSDERRTSRRHRK
jgi:hypothetical protein